MRGTGVAESLWSGYEGVERDDSGCISLWRSVIELIVHDLKSRSKYHNGKRNKDTDFYQKQEAEDLIFGYNKSHFDDLCTLACIDPDYVRRKIKEELYQK